MFCTECGNKLPEGVKFCPGCGAKLMTREAEPVVEATPIVAEPVQEVEPLKMVEPVAPAQIPVTPMQRPIAPMAQQKTSKVVKKKTGIDGSYFKSANYWMIFLGNLLAFIGCLLPFVSAGRRSASLFELSVGGGGAVIIAIIVCVVFTFVKPMVVFIPCIVSISIYGLLFMALIAEELLEALSVGAYTILIASIVALVGAVRFRKE